MARTRRKKTGKPALTTIGEDRDAAAAALLAIAPRLRRYRVGLPFQPTLDVEAADADAAKAKYREQCGILQTDHQFDVTPLQALVTPL